MNESRSRAKPSGSASCSQSKPRTVSRSKTSKSRKKLKIKRKSRSRSKSSQTKSTTGTSKALRSGTKPSLAKPGSSTAKPGSSSAKPGSSIAQRSSSMTRSGSSTRKPKVLGGTEKPSTVRQKSSGPSRSNQRSMSKPSFQAKPTRSTSDSSRQRLSEKMSNKRVSQISNKSEDLSEKNSESYEGDSEFSFESVSRVQHSSVVKQSSTKTMFSPMCKSSPKEMFTPSELSPTSSISSKSKPPAGPGLALGRPESARVVRESKASISAHKLHNSRGALPEGEKSEDNIQHSNENIMTPTAVENVEQKSSFVDTKPSPFEKRSGVEGGSEGLPTTLEMKKHTSSRRNRSTGDIFLTAPGIKNEDTSTSIPKLRKSVPQICISKSKVMNKTNSAGCAKQSNNVEEEASSSWNFGLPVKTSQDGVFRTLTFDDSVVSPWGVGIRWEKPYGIIDWIDVTCHWWEKGVRKGWRIWQVDDEHVWDNLKEIASVIEEGKGCRVVFQIARKIATVKTAGSVLDSMDLSTASLQTEDTTSVELEFPESVNIKTKECDLAVVGLSEPRASNLTFPSSSAPRTSFTADNEVQEVVRNSDREIKRSTADFHVPSVEPVPEIQAVSCVDNDVVPSSRDSIKHMREVSVVAMNGKSMEVLNQVPIVQKVQPVGADPTAAEEVPSESIPPSKDAIKEQRSNPQAKEVRDPDSSFHANDLKQNEITLDEMRIAKMEVFSENPPSSKDCVKHERGNVESAEVREVPLTRDSGIIDEVEVTEAQLRVETIEQVQLPDSRDIMDDENLQMVKVASLEAHRASMVPEHVVSGIEPSLTNFYTDGDRFSIQLASSDRILSGGFSTPYASKIDLLHEAEKFDEGEVGEANEVDLPDPAVPKVEQPGATEGSSGGAIMVPGASGESNVRVSSLSERTKQAFRDQSPTMMVRSKSKPSRSHGKRKMKKSDGFSDVENQPMSSFITKHHVEEPSKTESDEFQIDEAPDLHLTTQLPSNAGRDKRPCFPHQLSRPLSTEEDPFSSVIHGSEVIESETDTSVRSLATMEGTTGSRSIRYFEDGPFQTPSPPKASATENRGVRSDWFEESFSLLEVRSAVPSRVWKIDELAQLSLQKERSRYDYSKLSGRERWMASELDDDEDSVSGVQIMRTAVPSRTFFPEQLNLQKERSRYDSCKFSARERGMTSEIDDDENSLPGVQITRTAVPSRDFFPEELEVEKERFRYNRSMSPSRLPTFIKKASAGVSFQSSISSTFGRTNSAPIPRAGTPLPANLISCARNTVKASFPDSLAKSTSNGSSSSLQDKDMCPELEFNATKVRNSIICHKSWINLKRSTSLPTIGEENEKKLEQASEPEEGEQRTPHIGFRTEVETIRTTNTLDTGGSDLGESMDMVLPHNSSMKVPVVHRVRSASVPVWVDVYDDHSNSRQTQQTSLDDMFFNQSQTEQSISFAEMGSLVTQPTTSNMVVTRGRGTSLDNTFFEENEPIENEDEPMQNVQTKMDSESDGFRVNRIEADDFDEDHFDVMQPSNILGLEKGALSKRPDNIISPSFLQDRRNKPQSKYEQVGSWRFKMDSANAPRKPMLSGGVRLQRDSVRINQFAPVLASAGSFSSLLEGSASLYQQDLSDVPEENSEESSAYITNDTIHSATIDTSERRAPPFGDSNSRSMVQTASWKNSEEKNYHKQHSKEQEPGLFRWRSRTDSCSSAMDILRSYAEERSSIISNTHVPPKCDYSDVSMEKQDSTVLAPRLGNMTPRMSAIKETELFVEPIGMSLLASSFIAETNKVEPNPDTALTVKLQSECAMVNIQNTEEPELIMSQIRHEEVRKKRASLSVNHCRMTNISPEIEKDEVVLTPALQEMVTIRSTLRPAVRNRELSVQKFTNKDVSHKRVMTADSMNFRSSLRKKRKPLRSQTVGSFSYDSRMDDSKIDFDLLSHHVNEKDSATIVQSPFVSEGKIVHKSIQQVQEMHDSVHKIFEPDPIIKIKKKPG